MNERTESSGQTWSRDVDEALAKALGRREVAIPSSYLLQAAGAHLVLAPGAKRIRPWLVAFLGAQWDLPAESLVELAVASELIHTASLLHDDVVDSGALRRGRPTVNACWGNKVAVLGGDWTLTSAFRALWRYPQALTVYAVEVVSEM